MEGLFVGDCIDILKDCEDKSVNLIVTSPPYAEARKKTYGGIPINQYVDWFTERAVEFQRVLTDDGSFILNIKENVVKGERSTYVIELIQALRKQGWLWTEEYIWHKRNCTPGYWPNRFRDAWERCLHFNLNRRFYMDQDAVKVPIGDWAKSRLKNLSETDRIRDPSKSGSGFGKKVANWEGRELVNPDNVLHFATECSLKGHSAVFPEELPEWFIKLLSKEGDTILDPFVGSGTTCVVAKRLNRNFIGIDILPENIDLTKKRLDGTITAVNVNDNTIIESIVANDVNIFR